MNLLSYPKIFGTFEFEEITLKILHFPDLITLKIFRY